MSEQDPSTVQALDEFSNADLAITRESLYGTQPEPVYSGVTSLFRRAYRKDVTGADLAVVGIPFDLATTNRPGARLGPRAIRSVSSQLSWSRAWGWDSDPFDTTAVVDWGDVVFDPGRPDAVPAEIESQISQIVDQGVATLCLGGDHFIAYPVIRAHAKHHEDMALIHFDAHCDTWRDEEGRIDHGTMFFHAAQQGLINPKHSVQVGIRTHNRETHGFTIINADQVRNQSSAETIRTIRETVGDRPVYLTFDIDCLDPSYAPGTGTPVVGGLSTGQALEILRGLAGINLIGMDVVEVSPPFDVGEITALAAATIAQNLICLFAAGRAAR